VSANNDSVACGGDFDNIFACDEAELNVYSVTDAIDEATDLMTDDEARDSVMPQ
jgi:hypothetical protein